MNNADAGGEAGAACVDPGTIRCLDASRLATVRGAIRGKHRGRGWCARVNRNRGSRFDEIHRLEPPGMMACVGARRDIQAWRRLAPGPGQSRRTGNEMLKPGFDDPAHPPFAGDIG